MAGEKVILLVEDNPDDEALTVRALKKNNILNEVSVARDGVEALEFLFGEGAYADRDSSAMPQVVLLDLKLPKLDGLGVLRRLRANPETASIPVLLLTGLEPEGDTGADGIVHKPFSLDGLRSSVAACLRK